MQVLQRFSANAKLYNNHAGNAGDDIYNRDSATITFGPVGADWALDGGQDKLDCNEKPATPSTAGNDDSAGSRWNAHSVPTHVKSLLSAVPLLHDLSSPSKPLHDVIPPGAGRPGPAGL